MTGSPDASITVSVPADAKMARDWEGVTTRFGAVGLIVTPAWTKGSSRASACSFRPYVAVAWPLAASTVG